MWVMSQLSQHARWNGDDGTRWLALEQRFERELAPLHEMAFAAASPAPGEHVLDVG
jgi:hypothetical protein